MQYKSTIGADFLTKEVSIDGSVLQIQLWDTAGAERFNSMGPSFYRNSECCILVFDLTDPKSFEVVETWRDEFLNQLSPKDPEKFPFVLLGNKCDKVGDRKVQEEKIKKYCESKNGIPYFETSAKDSTNVDKAFEEVAKLALKRSSTDDIVFIPKVELKATNQRTQQKNCC